MRFLQILVAFVVVRILWGLIRSLFSKPANPTSAGPTGRTEQRGRVVGCERCGLHVPEERAVVRDGRTFCSNACAAASGD
ncbi:MAG: PP0621 family protein [Acidobacteriota bacterium]|nr:PP0621 family protein [Acidobacteriota bacterium]